MNAGMMVLTCGFRRGVRLSLGWMLSMASPDLLAHGSHSRLMARVDAALVLQPESGTLWYRRAQLDFEHGDLAESLLDLEKAANFSPENKSILWLKGRVLDAAGRPEEALVALNAFIAAEPGHWGSLASRARVERRLGLIEKAVADFRTALADHPDAEPDLVGEAAEALTAGGLSDEAVRLLESALVRIGPAPSLQIKLIAIEVQSMRYDAALKRLDDFQQSAPRPEPWMARRASLLAQAGKIQESRLAWRLLIDHVRQLPANERDCHAMTLASEQAHQALAALVFSRDLPRPNP